MKRLLLHVIVLLMRIVYAPMRLLPLQDKVTVISRQSSEPTVDIRMLLDYLRLRYPQIRCRALIRMIPEGTAGKAAYAVHMVSQMYHIATSRVVVLDGYCIAACVLPHKPRTRVIQMWHAIAAVKKFGYQTIGKAGGHSRAVADVMRMHKNYDYILSPGGEMEKIFCQAFEAGPDKMLRMGPPRLDLLWDSEDNRQKIREAFQIPDRREILLYAPTFRRDKPVYLKELVRSVDPERFALIIRLHPLEEDPEITGIGAPEGLQIILDRSLSTEEWIRASDRIITDYSALGIEAALTGKPIYFYLYDIASYEQSTGLNVDPRREIPGACAITGLQLAEKLSEDYDYEELRRFRDRFITIDTDACTARLGDFIYGIVKEIPQEVPDASSGPSGQGA